MLFGCRAAGTEANILFDSGADDNFVSASFAATQGLVVEPVKGSVLLGNNTEVNAKGLALVHLSLGAFHKAVTCLVLPDLMSEADIILGDKFMSTHSRAKL
jgi:hypothetical protein